MPTALLITPDDFAEHLGFPEYLDFDIFDVDKTRVVCQLSSREHAYGLILDRRDALAMASLLVAALGTETAD
jgi:hypothetical protein